MDILGDKALESALVDEIKLVHHVRDDLLGLTTDTLRENRGLLTIQPPPHDLLAGTVHQLSQLSQFVLLVCQEFFQFVIVKTFVHGLCSL
jgi:hypothetical protein